VRWVKVCFGDRGAHQEGVRSEGRKSMVATCGRRRVWEKCASAELKGNLVGFSVKCATFVKEPLGVLHTRKWTDLLLARALLESVKER